jgi:hypothetical protein
MGDLRWVQKKNNLFFSDLCQKLINYAQFAKKKKKQEALAVWTELKEKIISKFNQLEQNQQGDLRAILSGLLSIDRRTLVVLADHEEVSIGDIMLGIERVEEILANLEWTVGKGDTSGSSGARGESTIEEVD